MTGKFTHKKHESAGCVEFVRVCELTFLHTLHPSNNGNSESQSVANSHFAPTPVVGSLGCARIHSENAVIDWFIIFESCRNAGLFFYILKHLWSFMATGAFLRQNENKSDCYSNRCNDKIKIENKSQEFIMRHTRKQKSENFIHEFNSDNEVEIIPSEKDINGEGEEKSEQVGAYCRVSTMSEQQVESYELQKAYYEELVTRRPNWNLVDIYPDEGISATSMKNRKNFNKMLDDCKAGKITLIITKSVSRFARNVVDAISTIRMLRNLNPPVAVYFETEHIITTAPGADAQLSLLASFAESESLNKSMSMKWAIRNRFAHGIPRIVDTYGFKREGHQLLIDEDDTRAQVVKWMFYCYVHRGKNIKWLQMTLHKKKIPSPKGNEWWSYHTIAYILSNEKYAGHALMQKTVRTDMFLHRSVKNTGQERQYLRRNFCEPLIDIETFNTAQAMLGNMSPEDFLANCNVIDGSNTSDESLRYIQFPP